MAKVTFVESKWSRLFVLSCEFHVKYHRRVLPCTRLFRTNRFYSESHMKKASTYHQSPHRPTRPFIVIKSRNWYHRWSYISTVYVVQVCHVMKYVLIFDLQAHLQTPTSFSLCFVALSTCLALQPVEDGLAPISRRLCTQRSPALDCSPLVRGIKVQHRIC
jgi:hypothetical protein